MGWLEGKVQDSDRIVPLSCAYILFFFILVARYRVVEDFLNGAVVSTTPPYTAASGSACHTPDTGCGVTDDDAFEAPLCASGHA